MSDYSTILLERDASIVTITMNRPDALNAMNPTVLGELQDAVSGLADDDTLDAVVLTGAGRAFVAGADIKAMVDYTPEQATEFGELGHATMDAIAALPCVTIAAINGFALGGGLELALTCDLIYASEKAKLGLPEVGLGIIPGWGGTQRLGRRIGWHAARELVFTGKTIGADEAKRLGLVLEIHPVDELLDAVYATAKTIGSKGPLAVRTAKELMRVGADATLAQGLVAEREAFAALFGTSDQSEGMRAFVDRRGPNFTRS